MESFGHKDKMLVAYLRNELRDDEIVELEDELLRDEELFQRLQVVEMNLIDSYLRDEMTEEEKFRFEEAFLSNPANRRKFEEAQVFHESLKLLRKRESPKSPPLQKEFFQSIHFTRLAAAAVVLVVLGVLIAWFVTRPPDPDNLRASDTPPPATPDSRNTGTPNNTASPVEQPSPLPSNQPPQRSTTDRAQVAWLYLRDVNSGVLGSGDVPLTVRSDADILTLRFELPNDASTEKAIRVSIKDEMGYPVFPSPGTIEVKPISIRYRGLARRVISVDVPVSSFKNGTKYYFEIADPYASKTFTIRKRQD